MRVYLDISCLHRPFDDPTIDRIREEAGAVYAVLEHIRRGEWVWVGSEVLVLDVGGLPPGEAKDSLATWMTMCSSVVRLDDVIVHRAEALHLHGLRHINALHVACAEAGEADYFLTTDEHLRATCQALRPRVDVANPLEVAGESEPPPALHGSGNYTSERQRTLLDGNVREAAEEIIAARTA